MKTDFYKLDGLHITTNSNTALQATQSTYVNQRQSPNDLILSSTNNQFKRTPTPFLPALHHHYQNRRFAPLNTMTSQQTSNFMKVAITSSITRP